MPRRGRCLKLSPEGDRASLAGARGGLLIAIACLQAGGWLAFHDIGAGLLSAKFALPLVSYRALGCQFFSLGTCLGFVVAAVLPRFRWGTKGRVALGALQVFSCTLCYLCAAMGADQGIVAAEFLISVVSPAALLELLSALLARKGCDGIAASSLLVVVSMTIGHVGARAIMMTGSILLIGIIHGAFVFAGVVGYVAWFKREGGSPLRADRGEKTTFCNLRSFMGQGGRSIGVHIFSYGAIFGIAHVFPTGSGYEAILRSVPFLIGAVCAGVLAVALLRKKGQGVTVHVLWDLVTRLVFPLTMFGFFLMPLVLTAAYPVPAVLSEMSLVLYVLILISGCLAVSRETGISRYAALSFCGVCLFLGREVGSLMTLALHGVVSFDGVSFSVLSACAFLLLTFATLETGVGKGLKTFWGLCEKMDPRAYRDAVVEQRCAALAEQYGLTVREQEILFLLACGYRPRDIGEKLVIAISTARTHIQRIYAKFAVHSERELLDLVQEGGGEE